MLESTTINKLNEMRLSAMAENFRVQLSDNSYNENEATSYPKEVPVDDSKKNATRGR